MEHVFHLDEFWNRANFQDFSLPNQLSFDLRFDQVIVLDLISQFWSKIWVLSQTVAHVVHELRNSEVNIKLLIVSSDDFQESRAECTYETSLVVFHDVLKMISYEVWLEVGQVETAIIANWELVYNIQHDLVSLFCSYELLGQCFTEFVNLKMESVER